MSKRMKSRAYEDVIKRCGFGIPQEYTEGDMAHTYLNSLNITPQELVKHKKEIVDGIEDAYKRSMIDFANKIEEIGIQCQEIHDNRMWQWCINPTMDALHEMLDTAHEEGTKIKSDLWHDIYMVMGKVLANAKTRTQYAEALYGQRCGLVMEQSKRFNNRPPELGWSPTPAKKGGFKTEIGEDLEHMCNQVGVKMFDKLIYHVGPKMWGGDDDDEE